MLIRRISPAQTDPTAHRRLLTKRILLGIFVVLIGIAGWIGITGALALKNITAKNTNDVPSFFKFGSDVDPSDLAEGEGRINILSIGLADQGGTDTIQIISIDPINNGMAMLSVPRDLYVKDPKGGKSRINAIYVTNGKKCTKKTPVCDPDIDYGAAALKEVLEANLGIQIHYFAKINFVGLKKVVDAVGGLNVTVAKPLSDPGYPCDNDPGRPCGYYQAAGVHKMNGTQVLKYTRCRNGTCGSDFGRSRRQQEVMNLLREKLLSAGLLANPKKLTDIMSIAGSNFRTDMKLDEMLKLFKIADKIDHDAVTSTVLDNSAEGPLRAISSNPYLLAPKLGENNWTEVQEFVGGAFPEPYLIREKATITLVNASGRASLADSVAAKLKKLGYNVTVTETAPATQSATIIKYFDNKSPYTTALLKKRFSVTPSKADRPETVTTQILITLGTSYK